VVQSEQVSRRVAYSRETVVLVVLSVSLIATVGAAIALVWQAAHPVPVEPSPDVAWAVILGCTCLSAAAMAMVGPALLRLMAGFSLGLTVLAIGLTIWNIVDEPRVAAMPYPNGPSFLAGFVAYFLIRIMAWSVALVSVGYIVFLIRGQAQRMGEGVQPA